MASVASIQEKQNKYQRLIDQQDELIMELQGTIAAQQEYIDDANSRMSAAMELLEDTDN